MSFTNSYQHVEIKNAKYPPQSKAWFIANGDILKTGSSFEILDLFSTGCYILI